MASRPLIPLIVAPLSTILWIPVAYGVVNTFFWIGSSLLVYGLTFQITGDRRSSLGVALLLSSSPPTLLYFGSVMLEAGDTFFTLLILYFYLKLRNSNLSIFGLAALLSGVGILSKEITLPALASVIGLGLVDNKLRKATAYALMAAVPVIAWQIYTTVWIGENYLTHYLRAGLEYSETRYGVTFYTDLIDVVKAAALGHFPLAAIGFIVGFLAVSDRGQNLIFYSLLIPAVLSYYAWPFRDLRIAVTMFYATMPLAGVGVENIVNSLYSKPLIKRMPQNLIRTLLYLLHITASFLYVYNRLGHLSPPWDIYLFAPSSLQAGL